MSDVDMVGADVPHLDAEAARLGSSSPKGPGPRSRLGGLVARALRPGVRQGLIVVFDQGLYSIASFLSGVFVARACSKADYGLYVLGFSLLVIVTTVQGNLCGTPFTVFSPRLTSEDRKLYLGSTLIQHLGISLCLASMWALAAAVLVVMGQRDSLAGMLPALAVASLFVQLRDFIRYVFLAQLRVWASLAMGSVANLANVGLLFGAYRGQWLSTPAAYYLMAASSAMPALISLALERPRLAVARTALIRDVRRNVDFGKWLVGKSIAFTLAVRIYPFMLAGLRDTEEAAIYGACLALASAMNPLFVGLARYVGPRTAWAAAQGHQHVRRVVFLALAVLVGPLLVFLLAAFVFGEVAMTAVYGHDYAGTGPIIPIAVAVVCLQAALAVLDSGINAMDRADLGFKGRVGSMVATLLIGVPLLYLLGPVGAFLGLLFAQAVTGAYWLRSFMSLTSPRLAAPRR